MSHIWMSHVTHMNARRYQSVRFHQLLPCHTYEWVMSHIWMIHVTHMNARRYQSVRFHQLLPFHIYEWVMSHIRMNHVTHMNARRFQSVRFHPLVPCHTYEWVMSHIWTHVDISQYDFMHYFPATHIKSRVTHMDESHHTNESRHIYEHTSVWIKTHRVDHIINYFPVIHINESYHTHINESYHTNGHVTHMNTCHTYEHMSKTVKIMSSTSSLSHVQKSRVTHMNKSCHTNESCHTSERT